MQLSFVGGRHFRALERKMNEINRQVDKARRRIIVGKFFRNLCWALFAGLVVAAIGLAIPKIWAIASLDAEGATQTWNLSWMIGGAILSLLVAIGLTWFSRGSKLEAAIEVDKRFGLKERLSSALSLDNNSAETAAGTALIDDANKRAQKIDVRDAFPFKPTWKALLPLFPALVLVGLIFLPNAVSETKAASITPDEAKRKDVKIAIEKSKKKLIDKLNMLEEKGLKDAKLDFESLGRKLDELDADSGDLKKDALVKLNEIKKSIEEGKKQFGDAAEMKKEFNKLGQLQQGPARKLSEAISQGNFEEAQKSIRELAQKLRDGELNQVEQRQLAQNLQDMAKQVQDLADRHQAKQEELKERIQQAKQEGDLDRAAELEDQLKQMEQKDQKIQRMRQIAEKLQRAGEAMQRQQQQNQGQKQQGQKQQGQKQQGQKQQGQKQQGEKQQGQQQQGQKQQGQQQQQKGNGQPNKQNGAQGQKQGGQQGQPKQSQQQGQKGQPKEGQSGQQQGEDQTQQGSGGQPSDADAKAAQQALEDLAEEMDSLQGDLDALEALEDLEDDLQDSKDDMNGCEGDGMPGMGDSDKGGWKDWAKGGGRGGGKRERDESGKIGSYRSRVKGKIQRGETVVTGNADGENIPGQSITEARADIQSAILGDTDPLEDQKLPRSQREHAKQYFDKLRGK
jgi:hypothetical protein